MGNTDSASQNQSEPNSNPAYHLKKASGGGACPYSTEAKKNTGDKNGSGGCPYKTENQKKDKEEKLGKTYNVYAQEINPKNNMPLNPNQVPAEGQNVPLSTHRAPAAIPKGGAADGETWTYPSQQMFYNALQRKGKGGDVQEEDMDSVIAVHNSMNDQTWQKVLQWESMHNEGSGPKLSRFTGKPHTRSPKSTLLGFSPFHNLPEPFDRHDWFVDRDGREVRYVIDYYYVKDGEGNTAMPHSASGEETPSNIYVDVRPALDSPTALFDRIKATIFGLPRMEDEPIIHQFEGNSPIDPDGNTHQNDVAKLAEKIHKKCGNLQQELAACEAKHGEGSEECSRISLGMQVCLASIACPNQCTAFIKAMEASVDTEDTSDSVVDARYKDMVECLYGSMPETFASNAKCPVTTT